MTADDPRHGTVAGREQHRRDGENPCGPCHQAKLRTERRRYKLTCRGTRYRMPVGDLCARLHALHNSGMSWDAIAAGAGVNRTSITRALRTGPDASVSTRTWRKLTDYDPGAHLTPIGTRRRLQALACLGWSTYRIAADTGLTRETVRSLTVGTTNVDMARVQIAVAAAYGRLSMRIPRAATTSEQAGITRCRNRAHKARWAPPLAWDEGHIDHPNARPVTTGNAHRRKAEIHADAVLTAVLGAGNGRLTRDERRQAVGLLAALTAREIAAKVGCSERTVDRDLEFLASITAAAVAS